MTSTQQYVLISVKGEALFKAIGVYQNEQDAYAAANVCQMQSIEKRSAKWPKSMLADKQESIMELCRCIKEDFKSYKERFAYLTLQCSQIFINLEYDQHRVLPVEANNDNNIPPQSISESIFKTKVRNFMDVLRTKSDVEEDLGNSEDDDEDDEEEEEEEEEEEGDDEEEDIEDEGEGEEEDIEEEDVEEEVDEGVDEDEDIQEEEEQGEEDDEDEPVTSETAIQEHSEGEESEDQERPTLKRNASSLVEDGDAEDDEEDEIDEDDGDEDELVDDDDESTKRRRVVA